MNSSSFSCSCQKSSHLTPGLPQLKTPVVNFPQRLGLSSKNNTTTTYNQHTTNMISDKFYAIIAGLGASGRSLALKFSEEYPVVLLAQENEKYDEVVCQINNAGGKAIGMEADTANETSLASAFELMAKKFKDLELVVAIHNVQPYSRPLIRPFLQLDSEDLDEALDGNVYVLSLTTRCISNELLHSRGLFNFAQIVIPLLRKSVRRSPRSPTLIATGTTEAVKGFELWAVVAAAKCAARLMTQALAREFHPEGIHVAYVVIDGSMDVPRPENAATNDATPSRRMGPYAVSTYRYRL